MSDQLIRATASEGGIRAVGVITTQLTEEARRRHQLSYVATAALGRAMASGLLLASNMKQIQARVNLRIKGNGPLKGLFVDAGRDGTVRGYVDCPEIELPPTKNGKLNVGGAIGKKGDIRVLRDIGYGKPHSSTVELVSGEIGDDVVHYLAASEQIPSALIVGVFVGADGVSAAGGLLLQIMPKASQNEALITALESRIGQLSGFTPLLQQGMELPQIFQQLLGDLGLIIFPQTQPVRFSCRCSFERMLGALRLFGKAELEDMLHKDGGAEATCQFCNEVYQADQEQLRHLIEKL